MPGELKLTCSKVQYSHADEYIAQNIFNTYFSMLLFVSPCSTPGPASVAAAVRGVVREVPTLAAAGQAWGRGQCLLADIARTTVGELAASRTPWDLPRARAEMILQGIQ